ncbi:MAG: rRNA pseudouridine synthase [Bacteroidia bacterium]|nr:rRNA pseudouridine synthase [Bacteroidia bacterium]
MIEDEKGTRYGNTGSNRRDYDSTGADGKRRRRKRISRPEGQIKRITQERPKKEEPTEIRLNKYISNSGVCSRREADEIIAAGRVEVNGETVTVLGHKIQKDVEVKVDGKVVSPTEKVYILLNKPKDYITTTNDPQQRKTVMDLIEDVDAQRVYPVGRLDRNTTGILVFTNDGELAQRLMHPSGNVTKIYSVELDKPIEERHFYKLQKGIKLFDGFMKPDKLALVDREDKRKIGVQIHSGRNRVVRRMFEALGYEVIKLDRVIYANLDKQGMSRGQWRNLTEKEVSQLKRAARIR